MTLTADQRAAINRQNAAKSTGPTSEAGKEKSRANAVKHGLRAAVVALPNEDPEEVAARAEEWEGFYKPASPAARHLVDQCVRATLLADRVHRHHSAALAQQVREATKTWDEQRADEVEGWKTLLATDPAVAVRGLRKTAAGLRYMVGRWEVLGAEFAGCGKWVRQETEEAVRLLGQSPDPATLAQQPGAWRVKFLNVLCARGEPAPETLAWYVDPRRFPNTSEAAGLSARPPARDEARALLCDLIASELASLRDLAEFIEAEYDGPSRAEASDRASMLTEGASARLVLRYQAEARTSFHRAYGELVKTLARDAESPSPNEANPAAEAPSPNEANPAVESPAPNEANPEPEASPNEANPAAGEPLAAAPIDAPAPEVVPAGASLRPAYSHPGRHSRMLDF